MAWNPARQHSLQRTPPTSSCAAPPSLLVARSRPRQNTTPGYRFVDVILGCDNANLHRGLSRPTPGISKLATAPGWSLIAQIWILSKEGGNKEKEEDHNCCSLAPPTTTYVHTSHCRFFNTRFQGLGNTFRYLCFRLTRSRFES